jgi:hypothetical protein
MEEKIMKATMQTLLLVLAAAGLAAGHAAAATVVVAEGGSQVQLQAAVDALGGPGVILVPPGQWEFTGTVNVSYPNVTVLGAGDTRTRLIRTHEENSSFIVVRDAAWFRLSGFTIEGNGDPASTTSEYGVSLRNVTDFRVDHCSFAHLGFAGVSTNEATTGVVDHCSFLDIYKPAIANLGYGVVIYGIGTVEDVAYGSALATFAEDSFFSGCRHAAASNAGARYVFRYNHVTGNVVSHAIDTHGHEYTSADNGTEWAEIYGNLVDAPVGSFPAVGLRGGTGLVWSNTFNDYSVAVRLSENTDQDTGPVYVWDNTLTPSGGTMVSISTNPSPSPPADGSGLAGPDGHRPGRLGRGRCLRGRLRLHGVSRIHRGLPVVPGRRPRVRVHDGHPERAAGAPSPASRGGAGRRAGGA